MDLDRLDHLARAIAATGSRRRLLSVLGVAPVLGGLFGLAEGPESAAKERRRRRKQRHKRRKNPGQRKGKGCRRKSTATVCAGRCGPVKGRDTCGKTVDCGSCDCVPPCGTCFTCQGAAGAPSACVPQKAGTPCGAGDVCCAGTCQECCDRAQCLSSTKPVCAAGSCAACSADPGQCPSGTCCANDGTCATGTADDACGSSGMCTQCTAQEVCFEQDCCTPATCATLGKTCGSWSDGCGGTLSCGTCGTGATPACKNGTCDTCANTCGSDCVTCLNLVDGTTLCAAGNGIACPFPCSANADCSSGAVCVSNRVTRATGEVRPVSNTCGSPAVCGGVNTTCSAA